jgi:hypothetical protein
MALFSITDIKFKTDNRKNTNTLSKSDNFKVDVLRYPEDLGSLDKGHYMIFHINVSQLTNETYKCRTVGPQKKITTIGDVGNAAKQTATGVANEYAGAIVETISNLSGGVAKSLKGALQSSPQAIGAINYVGDVITSTIKPYADIPTNLSGFNIARKVNTITDTIALYMPNTLNFTHTQDYQEISRNDVATSLSALHESLKDVIGDPSKVGANLSPFLSQLLKPAGELIKSPGTVAALFAGQFGIVNPRLELIYRNPVRRNFRFDFMFYPRSEQEALEVQRIIQKFKYHQAPELKTGTAGQFLVPPSDFNVEFYYNGRVNDNIPKIKGPCILRSIEVDYAPDGFRAYESFSGNDTLSPSLGKTGMPVGIRMGLAFEELEFMTKDAYKENDV